MEKMMISHTFNTELTADNLHMEAGLTTLVRYVNLDHYSTSKAFFPCYDA
jgi:hypothetical protein